MNFLSRDPDIVALAVGVAGMALALAFVALVIAVRARESARDARAAVASLSRRVDPSRLNLEPAGPTLDQFRELERRVDQLQPRPGDSRSPASKTEPWRWQGGAAEDSREARRLGLITDPPPGEPDVPAAAESPSALAPRADSWLDEQPAQPIAPQPQPQPAPAPAPPAPSGDPVEFDGEVLSLSRSLNALGILERGASGDAALLYLNPDVEVDHIVREKWASLFAFNGGRSYVRYRTVHPARVRWDEGTQMGVPLSPGVAEVIQ